MKSSNDHKHYQYKLPLGEEVNNLEQEARMVLPGIQTLFGFQLMVVFNSSFKANITPTEQHLHLVSLLLVVISGVLVAAPAAYHRQAHHHISEHFIELSSRFLSFALVPLAIGTCLDIFIVSKIITESEMISLAVAGCLFCLYAGVWFIYPQVRGQRIAKLPVRELKD